LGATQRAGRADTRLADPAFARIEQNTHQVLSVSIFARAYRFICTVYK
jgi:hypothetical protein